MPDALAEVGKKYGGGTKYKAVWDRMTQLKAYAKLINEAIQAGDDPITVELNDAPGRNGQGSQIAVLSALFIPLHPTPIFSIWSRFGVCYNDFDRFTSEVAKLHGGGTKYFAIWSFMSQINGHAAALREAYDSGIDPITVELNSETAARGKKKAQGNKGLCPASSRLFCFLFCHNVGPMLWLFVPPIPPIYFF